MLQESFHTNENFEVLKTFTRWLQSNSDGWSITGTLNVGDLVVNFEAHGDYRSHHSLPLTPLKQTDLFSSIRHCFNDAELKKLTEDLAIDYEDLQGSTKSEKIQSLVAYLKRRGQIDELIVKLTQERPNFNWHQSNAKRYFYNEKLDTKV